MLYGKVKKMLLVTEPCQWPGPRDGMMGCYHFHGFTWTYQGPQLGYCNVSTLELASRRHPDDTGCDLSRSGQEKAKMYSQQSVVIRSVSSYVFASHDDESFSRGRYD